MSTTTKKSPAQVSKLQQEILIGRLDGHLVDIADAIAARMADATGPTLLWRITLGDDTWSSETVTIGELRYIETATGVPYLELHPGKSMNQFAAIVTAHFHKVHGVELKEARDRADAISQQDALSAIDLYEGKLGKDSGATSS
jgi:hypothetical protein